VAGGLDFSGSSVASAGDFNGAMLLLEHPMPETQGASMSSMEQTQPQPV